MHNKQTVALVQGVGEVIMLLPCVVAAILPPVQVGVTATVKMQIGLSPGFLLLFPDQSLTHWSLYTLLFDNVI